MKNKIKLKKMIIGVLSILVFTLIIFSLVYSYQYKVYTMNFNNKIMQIVTAVKEKYPDVSESEIFRILNNAENSDTELFYDYGIEVEKSAILLRNDKDFKLFLVINCTFIVMFTLAILYLFLLYNKSKERRLAEITKFVGKINKGDYLLDIEENTEDELSILKNELYKTTVMLRESAENSKQDKISLKKSLTDISHQLKTPLTSIMILLDNIIENGEMDSKTKEEFAKDTKREVININFLVQALLKLSKLDVNSVTFLNEEIYLKDIVSNSIKNVATLCDLKNINIKVTNNTAKAFCDLKWQTEAITNILKNCIEHSENSSVIEILCEENEVYSKIEIKDFGKGIDKEDLKHIFERFYKGKNASADSIGIGLALSKSIVQKNNGSINATSELGKGTKFVIKYFKYMK